MVQPSGVVAAVRDIVKGAQLAPVWWRVGLTQTFSRYKRTILGPFWIAGGLVATAVALTFVYGSLFHADYRQTFPNVMAGLLVWFMISSTINEGAQLFINSAGMMQVHNFPSSFYVYLHVFRQAVNFAHQLMAFALTLLLMGLLPVPNIEVIPGLLILIVTMFFVSLVTGTISARYRDIGYMTSFAVQFLFFLMPIFWTAEQLGARRRAIVDLNPFAQLLEVVRQPLLGHTVTLHQWMSSLGLMAVSAVIGISLLAAFRRRIVFWL